MVGIGVSHGGYWSGVRSIKRNHGVESGQRNHGGYWSELGQRNHWGVLE